MRITWKGPALAALAVLGLVAGPRGTGAAAAPPAVPPACPAAVPVSDIKPGLVGTGWTVSQGTAPQPFTVTVLGVLPGAIAPGVDMVVFQGDSPALTAAGGIWAGMSGSPVYTKDGRLIGSVSYGLTAAPSPIGGITPAASMLTLLGNPSATGTKAAATVPLPRGLAGHAAAPNAGLAPLTVPLAVSGLSASRLGTVNARLQQSGSPLRAYAGSAAPGSAAPAGGIFPGSNFAAAVSYGDLTEAAIGTTTAVCGSTALAFGHPMTFGGAVNLSAHTANAVAVVKDATFGSFKLATVGPIAGTVDQDRTVGLRAKLGAGPKGTVPVRSTVHSGTRARTATTWVTMDRFLADVATNHLLGNLDRVFDQVGTGQATVSWTIRGTQAGGPDWQLTHSDRYASQFDAAYESITELYGQIQSIVGNPYATVKITDVSVTATITPDYGQYTVESVQAKENGAWVNLTDTVRVTPGATLDLRVRLAAYRAPDRLVDVALKVPAGAVDSGSLSVVGGLNESAASPAQRTFAALLASLRDAPRNDTVTVSLNLSGAKGDRTVQQVVPLDQVVDGEQDYSVTT